MKKNNSFTEEGQTRFRNTFRQVRNFSIIMFIVGAGCGVAIHFLWVMPSLTPLQRIYLRQYLRSTVKSYWCPAWLGAGVHGLRANEESGCPRAEHGMDHSTTQIDPTPVKTAEIAVESEEAELGAALLI